MKIFAALMVGLLWATVAVTATAVALPTTCVKRSGTTLLSNSQVRVYETEPDASEEGTLTRLWACRLGSTRRESLIDAYESPFGEGSYSNVRLAGQRIAFLVSSVSADEPPTYDVMRFDMGSRRLDKATVTRPVRLVMSRAGGVAWIESGAVRALGGSGADTLDPGPAKAGSLKRAGRSSVSWVRDGQRRTARVS